MTTNRNQATLLINRNQIETSVNKWLNKNAHKYNDEDLGYDDCSMLGDMTLDLNLDNSDKFVNELVTNWILVQ